MRKELNVCQTCGWEGSDEELIAISSDMEPSCPDCLNNDFLDWEEEEEDL